MPATDKPEVAERRRRLAAWISAHYESQADFLLDFKRLAKIRRPEAKLAQSEVTGLLTPNGKSFGEKKARDIEVVLGMPPNHLLVPAEPAPPASIYRIRDSSSDSQMAGDGKSWGAYILASRETQMAVDLLLLPSKQRKVLAKQHELVYHCIEQLELRAPEVLKALKSA